LSACGELAVTARSGRKLGFSMFQSFLRLLAASRLLAFAVSVAAAWSLPFRTSFVAVRIS